MSFWSESTIKGGRFGLKNQCSVDIMAAGGQNLEELVRRIVSSVHNLTESSNTVMSGNNAAGSGNTSNPMVNYVDEEINQRFLLPRASTSTATTATVAGFHANNDYGYSNYRSRPRQRNPPYEISSKEQISTQVKAPGMWTYIRWLCLRPLME